MQTRRMTWLSGLGLMVLCGGVSLSAEAAPPVKEDPHLGVTQNWDKNLPSATRFTVLTDFGGAAVRDNNTGLVWEQAVDATPRTWSQARNICVNKNVGGTEGWRLSSVVELVSVQDPSPSVFTIPPQGFYWSASTSADSPTDAWAARFGPAFAFTTAKTSITAYAWCVRGGMNADVY
jgi:hypothetical protein